MSAKYNISATRLKLLRTKYGLTQQEFANKVGLSARTYAAYERGERKLPRETEEKIKQIFGITPYDLFLMPSPQKLAAALDEVTAAEEKKPTAETVDELTKIFTGLMSDFTDEEVREIRDYVRYLRWKRYRAEV